MHLIRYGRPGQERPGLLLEDGRRKDCSVFLQDYDWRFWAGGGLRHLEEMLDDPNQLSDVDEAQRWAPPFPQPGKVIGIGLNYHDHARESGMAPPDEPVVFLKAPNALVGPHDPILLPRGSEKVDYEVELGILIAKEARYLDAPESSSGHIAGYCIANDVSERAFQLERSGLWTKGKSCDSFLPVGQILTIPSEVSDVCDLRLRTWVNGELRQDSSTREMVFEPHYLVYYLSQFMTLEPGDLIITGTPPGVGMGRDPKVWLQPGDVVEMEIDGMGRTRNVCEPA